MKVIVWIRRDLRTWDNRALHRASTVGDVIPVYILEDESDSGQPLTNCARAWWLAKSLVALKRDLPGLVFRRGRALDILEELTKETGATSVFWNNRYEPEAVKCDESVKSVLTNLGVDVQSYKGSLLHEPWDVVRADNAPYKVYTPYLRTVEGLKPDPPLPRTVPALTEEMAVSENPEDWNLVSKSEDWYSEWSELWSPGEQSAIGKLEEFVRIGLKGYSDLRDQPELPNVSRLSPHLHFGEISASYIAHRIESACLENPGLVNDARKFMSELIWRDYANHLLHYYPNLPFENWKSSFDAYPWCNDEGALRTWQRGKTGYPLVDAGMRELWYTGYMHNRVRMVAASFLTKHLRIDWRNGARWFLETLLDADLANNSFGWQWVAGCGADAAPYFRIFNPILQGRKFDPNGEYIRKWCPELANLATRYVHDPSSAPVGILAKAGVTLGGNYPFPMVDHGEARRAALAGFEHVKNS